MSCELSVRAIQRATSERMNRGRMGSDDSECQLRSWHKLL